MPVPDLEPDVARGPVRETSVDAPCPVCGRRPLVVRSLELELPYFGEALETTLLCSSCGYRHADLLLMRRRGAVRLTLHVTSANRLSARVARSASATVRIPELGASIEPGPRADAFISNVEGVLRKFLDVVRGQEAVAASAADRTRLSAVRRRLEAMREGRDPCTLILEDPMGNSDIQHEDVVREALSPAEARRLRSSETVLDLADLARSREDE